jgi:hypothetical protein
MKMKLGNLISGLGGRERSAATGRGDSAVRQHLRQHPAYLNSKAISRPGN